jgi:hypothetical protein
MKMKTVLLLLVGLFCFATTQPVLAITSPTSAVSASMIEKQSKELKKEFNTQKKLNKIERFFAKRGVDFSDPVKKWLWFWVFGWAAALVLIIIAGVVVVGTASTVASGGTTTGGGFGVAGILYLLGWLCGLFGTISLIVWFIKKNG